MIAEVVVQAKLIRVCELTGEVDVEVDGPGEEKHPQVFTLRAQDVVQWPTLPGPEHASGCSLFGSQGYPTRPCTCGKLLPIWVRGKAVGQRGEVEVQTA